MLRRLCRFAPLALAAGAVGGVTSASSASAATDAQTTGARPLTPASQYSVARGGGGSWHENWDLRAPVDDTTNTEAPTETDTQKPSTKKKKNIRHHILLIRHGQYVHEKTDTGRKLTELGWEQATLAGARVQALAAAGAVPPIKYVYASTMRRATETSVNVYKELRAAPDTQLPQVEACSLIREGAVCPPVPTHSSWKPSSESFAKDGIRIEAAFLNHIHRPDPDAEESYTTVLVCHGNVIRYFALRALQLPPEAWLRTSLHNGSITHLSVSATGHVSMEALGDAGFMPVDKLTFN